MPAAITLVTLRVRDYDDVPAFCSDALRFTVLEDRRLEEGKRWVRVAPAGGRVCLFLETDEFWGHYRRRQARGVRFAEAPRQEPYGWVVVFFDLYGNRWDLLQASGV